MAKEIKQIRVMCSFESVFDVPEEIASNAEAIEEFVFDAIGSSEMLSDGELAESGLLAVKTSDGIWTETSRPESVL